MHTKTVKNILVTSIILLVNISLNLAATDNYERTDLTDTVNTDVEIYEKTNEDLFNNETVAKQNTSASENEEGNIPECVGDAQFCNLTEEDYVSMLNDYIPTDLRMGTNCYTHCCFCHGFSWKCSSLCCCV
uniref:Uncharacterized protein n=1 Tax=Pectinophora gossypiella TaxID=13191 RepID=A0A1E1VYL6_PECGO